MADPVPPLPDAPPPLSPRGKSPFTVWMERSGTSGKVMAGAAGVGIISTFLPIVSVSGGGFVASSAAVIADWRGVFCLLAYIAVLVLGFLVAQKSAPQNRGLLFGALGAAGGAVLFALLLFLAAMNTSGGGMISISIGIGTILNFLSAIGVGVGAFLMAKENKLF